MSASPGFRVFLSAVTSELCKARDAVAADLRSRGLTVNVESDFRQEEDTNTTLSKLHKYIRELGDHSQGAVVCMIGARTGSFPPDSAAKPYEQMLPAGVTRASYTQWEFYFARHYGQRLSLYLAKEDYTPDKDTAGPNDDAQLQQQFVDQLKNIQGLDRTYFSTIHELRAEVLREDWPQLKHQRAVHLPYPSLGTLFKGREQFLAELREGLQQAMDGQATAIVGKAVHGLGGVGKTRLAVEYAWQHADDYSAVLFVMADTPQGLQSQLAGLVGPLVLDLPEQEATDETVQLAAVLRWLREHPGWFLILDNVDSEPAARAAETLLAQLHGGQVLITSRLTNWAGCVKSLSLDVLAAKDAAQFLLERTEERRHKTATDEADAEELARELDGLAPALEQAGAYISRQRISLRDYLTQWKAHEPGVQDWYDERLMQYPRSVAVTWETTLVQLLRDEVTLLRLLSWFAPDPIPLFVLEVEQATEIWRKAVSLLEEDLQFAEGETPDLRSALLGLSDYSMLRWEADGESVSVHRVVQEIVRNRLPEEQRSDWLTACLQLLWETSPANPDDVRTWPQWDALRGHVELATQFANEAAIPEPTARLMNQLGVLLHAKALYAEAEPLMRRALAIGEQTYGPDHPEVALRLNNLAQLLQATNRLSDAESLMRRALAIDELSYGPDHPTVAIRLNNLGLLLKITNRLAEAEPLMRRALRIDEQSFGPDHPNVSRDLNNLALLLHDAKRLAEAEALMRQALAIDKQSFGLNHPDVAIHLNNLAALLHNTNRLGEAEPLIRSALAISEQSYGPDHPDIAIRLNNLAQLLWDTNRPSEAEPMMRRVVEILHRFGIESGHQHPQMFDVLSNYTELLEELGLSHAGIARKMKDFLP